RRWPIAWQKRSPSPYIRQPGSRGATSPSRGRTRSDWGRSTAGPDRRPAIAPDRITRRSAGSSSSLPRATSGSTRRRVPRRYRRHAAPRWHLLGDLVVEVHRIPKARAPAWLHGNTKGDVVAALFDEELFHLARCGLGQRDHRASGWGLVVTSSNGNADEAES